MALRYATTVVVAATILATAAAVGVSASEPARAEAASDVTVRSCTGGDITLSATEKRSLDLHNGVRKSRGLRALCVHPKLQKAARAYSRDMIDRDYFSHTSKDGLGPGARLRRAGYDWRLSGENIAWGSGPRGSAERTFKVWMNSPHHRSNILDGGLREVGIGTATGAYERHGRATMWTTDFGAR
jgi:uncharacterized protein YkwD